MRCVAKASSASSPLAVLAFFSSARPGEDPSSSQNRSNPQHPVASPPERASFGTVGLRVGVVGGSSALDRGDDMSGLEIFCDDIVFVTSARLCSSCGVLGQSAISKVSSLCVDFSFDSVPGDSTVAMHRGVRRSSAEDVLLNADAFRAFRLFLPHIARADHRPPPVRR